MLVVVLHMTVLMAAVLPEIMLPLTMVTVQGVKAAIKIRVAPVELKQTAVVKMESLEQTVLLQAAVVILPVGAGVAAAAQRVPEQPVAAAMAVQGVGTAVAAADLTAAAAAADTTAAAVVPHCPPAAAVPAI
ncbi:MAG: hypothetical protein LBP26_00455 [Clostridiales bacterium]|nr:hypothetical protein [Clostridiales bacterium]